MKVFVAGATGAIGRALVPQLVARGHEVVGGEAGRRRRSIRTPRTVRRRRGEEAHAPG